MDFDNSSEFIRVLQTSTVRDYLHLHDNHLVSGLLDGRRLLCSVRLAVFVACFNSSAIPTSCGALSCSTKRETGVNGTRCSFKDGLPRSPRTIFQEDSFVSITVRLIWSRSRQSLIGRRLFVAVSWTCHAFCFFPGVQGTLGAGRAVDRVFVG